MEKSRITSLRAEAMNQAHDRWLDSHPDGSSTEKEQPQNELDGEKDRKLLSRLLSWYDTEMKRQAPNRYQMAIDNDFYDGLQWSEEDMQELMARGQNPVSYNDIKPVIDWVIGAEKRMRIDSKVLPRTDDDVDMADVKTKVMKYYSDVNLIAYHRSDAFAEAVKCGLSWLEDSAQNIPGKEVMYNGWESWRNVLYDSNSIKRSYSDGRYLFRWRYLDQDVAEAMFPNRKSVVKASAIDGVTLGSQDEDEIWYLGQNLTSDEISAWSGVGRRTFISDTGWVDSERPTVKVIEGWYRAPLTCHFCEGDVFDGEEFDPKNEMMRTALEQHAISLKAQTQLVVFCALFTRKGLLAKMRSPYKHDRFPLTPIWVYRRGRDNAPYGMIRNIRDPQESKNKRMSKALFALSTNQIIADDDSVEDWDVAREEANRPDGVIQKKRGSEFTIRRDYSETEMLMKYADNDGQQINKGSGVTEDNLGRQTNAQSGYAIERRQDQGSLSTAEVFDGFRLAVQLSGENELSIIEQFVKEPKVYRLTGYKGKLEWVKVNQPVIGENGEEEYLNDITATKADFVVDSQDFTASMRQALSEELMQQLSKYPPELAIKLLDMVVELFDFPGKDEFVARIREINGMPDPEEKEDPEKMAAMQEQQAAQDEIAAGMAEQEQLAVKLENEERAAKIAKLNAEAEKIRAENGIPPGEQAPDDGSAAQERLTQIEQMVTQNLEEMRDNYAKAAEKMQSEAREALKVGDDKLEVERIRAASAERVAEVNAESKLELLRAQKEQEDQAEKSIARAVQPLLDQIDSLNDRIEMMSSKEKKESEEKEQVTSESGTAAGEDSSAAILQALEKINKFMTGGREISVTKGKDGNVSGTVKVAGTDVVRSIQLSKDKSGNIKGSIKPETNVQGDSQ